MEDVSKLEIQMAFKDAIQVSKSEKICTNGSYRISPRYTYNKQKRSFAGYQGDITFKCEFKDAKKLDSVISGLDKISSKKDKFKLTVNPINWELEKQNILHVKKELELEALLFANRYREFLNDIYKTTCKVKDVFLNPTSRDIIPSPKFALMRESQSQTTAPIMSQHTIKYSASYSFECN